MSALDDLLGDLRNQGITIQAHGSKLRYHPRSAMTDTLLKRLKAHKGILLAILGANGYGDIALGDSRGCSDDLVRVNVAFHALNYLLAVQSPQMVPDGIIPGRSLDPLEGRLRAQALLLLTDYLGEVVS